jgi:hypothetical protein
MPSTPKVGELRVRIKGWGVVPRPFGWLLGGLQLKCDYPALGCAELLGTPQPVEKVGVAAVVTENWARRIPTSACSLPDAGRKRVRGAR